MALRRLRERVGASAASKLAPDGYGFFVGAAHHAIAPALYPKLDYNIETDFVPVAVISLVLSFLATIYPS
ncbi:MAG: hypothetical protein U1A07_02730, partial [Phenylobacterium sp.]|nr:hypothetical protein [Phenylobacterium sp.]